MCGAACETPRKRLVYGERSSALVFESRRDALLARDRLMVDSAEQGVAFHYQGSSGTAYTLAYAQEKGLPVDLKVM